LHIFSVFNKFSDIFFIKAPFLFPLVYLYVLFNFPSHEYMLALITLLLLGEPHFGATWTIFFDKKIREYAYVNKITFIYGSIVLLIFSTLLFITSKNIFYLLFFGFNAYHVTRQSIGICSLFTTSAAEKNFQKKIIYLFNITIVFLSICYLMLDLIDSISAMKIGYLYLFISGIVIVFQYVKFNSWENTLTTLTGLTIFAPALFVETYPCNSRWSNDAL